MVLTNDLKKGDKVVLRNGWTATIEDNKKGNIRLAKVNGFVTKLGSIYVWDISHTATHQPIELTEAQKKAHARVRAAGF